MERIQRIKELASLIRQNTLDMAYYSGANGGHLGGAYSSAEILAVLYDSVLNTNPDMTISDNRDRFILSKGHIALAHYAVLAEKGFITKEEMLSFEKSGSEYQTHETINVEKGIEFSGGSLGYGASLGVGTALSARIKGLDYHTYVLLGDGECNEGCVWEAIMSSARYGLSNITFIIDVNKQQLDGFTEDIIPISNIKDVCTGFGCEAISINGNDIEELLKAFDKKTNRPKVIIANTVKMKGVPSVEGKVGYHHVRLNDEQYQKFKQELEV